MTPSSSIAARCGFGTAETMRRNFIRDGHVARPVPQDVRLEEKSCRSPSCCTRASPRWTSSDPTRCCAGLPDAEVRFVWHEPGPITADSGVLVVGATHSFDETPSPDIILVPGGFSTMEHARDEKVLDWVRRAHETATWTTSVCSGSIMLAAAGLLEGKRATSHWAALSRAEGAWASSRLAMSASWP